MRLAWRLATREVSRRKGRTLMVVLLVALTVGGLTAADLAYRSHQLPDPSNFGAAQVRLTSNPTVNPAETGASSSYFDAVLSDLPIGAEVAVGQETFGLPVQRADRPGLGDRVSLTTVALSSPVLQGATVVRAGRIATGPDEVTVGTAIADRLQLSVGDSLHLVQPDVTYTVVGIADMVSGDNLLFHAPGFPVEQLTPGAATNVAYVAGVPDDWYPSFDSVAFVGVEYPPVPQEPAPEEILIVWLAMTLLLGALGIVIAAAFAASGRRQLVTLGQLGANGAEPRFARRFLAMQGAATSALGALVGIAGGVVVAAIVGDPILQRGEWDVRVFDLVVIAGTTIVVGTLAALMPTRSLAKTPVLTALAGRAPVRVVPRWQVPLGVIAVAGGLGVLGLSVSSVAAGTGDAPTIVAALLGGAAVLGGVCARSPKVVDQWRRLGGSRRGTVRLTLRSMVRHRARSAALVAAIAVVGGAGVAGASGVERWRQLDRPNDIPGLLNVVTVSVGPYGAESVPPIDVPATDVGLDDLRADVDQIVPGVAWNTATMRRDDTGITRFVADDATLTALGVPRSQWSTIRAHDEVYLARSELLAPEVVVPELRVWSAAMLRPAVADAAPGQWHETSPAWIGVAPTALTDEQRQQLTAASFGAQYPSWYADLSPDESQYSVEFEYPPSTKFFIGRDGARWLVIGGLLLLVTIIVSIGLALWAAEGRVERDQLIAVGAPPAALARMAGVRAWVISTTGGIIAVPLGWAILWTILHAADKESPFPTVTALMVVLAIPLIVAVGAVASSRVAQAVRPVTGSSMSLD